MTNSDKTPATAAASAFGSVLGAGADVATSSDRFTFSGQVDLFAPTKGKPRQVKMVVATGQRIPQHGWFQNLYVDLQGITIPRQKLPILLDHDSGKRVGFTSSIKVTDDGLVATGSFLTNSEAAQQVQADFSDGFPWECSCYLPMESMEEVGKDKTAKVNGETITGPANIIRQSTLREVTLTAVGADGGTSAEAFKAKTGKAKPTPSPQDAERAKWAAEFKGSKELQSEFRTLELFEVYCENRDQFTINGKPIDDQKAKPKKKAGMTWQTFKEQHPGVFMQIWNGGLRAGVIEGHQAKSAKATEAERARCERILLRASESQHALALKFIIDGTDTEAATDKFLADPMRNRHRLQLENALATQMEIPPALPIEQPQEAKTDEEKWRADFNANRDLQREFSSADAYAAFCSLKGQATINGEPVK